MSNRHRAYIWAGEEQEYDGDGLTLYCDQVSVKMIKNALEEYPDANELYFAHGFQKEVVEHFLNKIKVTLEVPRVSCVPSDVRGRVNLILRIPSDVDGVKVREGDTVRYTDTFEQETEWDGRKVYEEDTIVHE